MHVSNVHQPITFPTSQPLWKTTTTQERNNCNDRTQFQHRMSSGLEQHNERWGCRGFASEWYTSHTSFKIRNLVSNSGGNMLKAGRLLKDLTA